MPPFDPAQDQVQGPDPPTALAMPVEQRLVIGAVETVVLLDDPHVPLIEVEATAKVAPTFLAASIKTVQGPVPVQDPFQPIKILPTAEVAVRVTEAPLAKLAKQLTPQEIPTGAELIDPLPDTEVVSK